MKRLALLVMVATVAACGDDPAAPPPGFAPSVWAWSGPEELSPTLQLETLQLDVWEHGAATLYVEETENGLTHTLVYWGSYSATESTVSFRDGPEPFPLTEGSRPAANEISSILAWKGYDVPVVLTRVPDAVPE